MNLYNHHKCCNCKSKNKNFYTNQKIIELLRMIIHLIFINVLIVKLYTKFNNTNEEESPNIINLINIILLIIFRT